METIIIIVFIIALLGNLYLFSGGDVDGDVAVFMVFIAIAFDALIFGFAGKKVIDVLSARVQNRKDNRLTEIKKQATDEIIDRIKYKQEILDELNMFFREKSKVISFAQLILTCSNDNDILGEYQKNENLAFKKVRANIIAKLDRKEAKYFPTDIVQVDSYVRKLKKEIKELRDIQISIQDTDGDKLNEILQTYCPIVPKNKKRKKENWLLQLL